MVLRKGELLKTRAHAVFSIPDIDISKLNGLEIACLNVNVNNLIKHILV